MADDIILVDERDRELGHAPVSECHDGRGRLHRAFSVFLMEPQGRVLLQQRAAGKRLWPLFWSNSCCSHPRRGESVEAAAVRRVREELGVGTELSFLYKFRYQAEFEGKGSENELCSVLYGRIEGDPVVDPVEVAAWRWVSPDLLDRELADPGARFTPWLRLEWARLRREHPGLFQGPAGSP